MVRAKFVVTSIDSTEIKMQCQYSPEIPEDQAFYNSTPWGEVRLSINNPKALEQFEVGKSYYADFSPA